MRIAASGVRKLRRVSLLVTLILTAQLAGFARAEDVQPQPDPNIISLKVNNLTAGHKISVQTPVLLWVETSKHVKFVKVLANGKLLGNAERRPDDSLFRFRHTFTDPAEVDLEFQGFEREENVPIASAAFRVQVIQKLTPPPSRIFNRYILKAVDYLAKNWGLLGYNINAQLTHPVEYHKFGVLQPTKGGLTMCVSAALEVILTAFELYSIDSNQYTIYNFLPFASWNTLKAEHIKAHIWVDPKLGSFGTADAIAKFGIGEKVKFKDLQPGSFVNINRTTGTGHAVTFLNFINLKGEEVPRYDDTVAGFRYFGAQGRSIKGEGGLSYRHAFFSNKGCPDVPFQRDCNVIYSENSKILNTGMMLDPPNWKKKPSRAPNEPLMPGEEGMIHAPSDFDGLTTDD